jgi:hypothetical protein
MLSWRRCAGLVVSLALFLCSGVAFGQSVAITGRVVDQRGLPVPYANVAASTDSLVRRGVRYGMPNAQGDFRVVFPGGLPSEGVWITVRSLGYAMHRARYSAAALAQPVRVVLQEEKVDIEGVRVVADAKRVYAKGDTLIFNTDGYLKGDEHTLGEMLQRIPGMEVQEGGGLYFMGKPINKILVNGKDVLSSSTSTTLNTLPADFAHQVEVIKDYKEGDVVERFRPQERQALNLKSRFPFKLNGSLEGGGGVLGKYYGRGSLIGLLSSVSVSALANVNNVGRATFSEQDGSFSEEYDELLGGKGGGGSPGAELDLFSATSDEYERNAGAANVNVKWQPTQGYKVRLSGIYGQMATRRAYAYERDYLVGDVGLHVGTTRQSARWAWLSLQSLSQRWIPNPNFSLKAFTHVVTSRNGEGIRLQEDSPRSSQRVEEVWRARDLMLTQTLELNQAVWKGLLTAGGYISYSPGRTDGDYWLATPSLPFTPHVQAARSNPYNYGYWRDYKPLSYSAYVRCDVPLYRDVHAVAEVALHGSRRMRQQQLVDSPGSETIAWMRPQGYLGLQRNKGFFRFELGNYVTSYRLRQSGMPTRGGFRWEPKLRLQLNFMALTYVELTLRRNYIGASYSELTQLPWLQRHSDLRLPSRLQNPLASSNVASLFFTHFDLLNNVMIFANATYSDSRNGAISVYDAFTQQLATWHYEGAGRTQSASAWISANTGLGRLPVDLTAAARYTWGKSHSRYAQQPVQHSSNSYSGSLGFSTRFKGSPIDFSVEASARRSRSQISTSPVGSRYHEYTGKAAIYITIAAFSLTLRGQSLWGQASSYRRSFMDVGLQARYKWEHFELRASVENVLHLRKNEWVEESLSALQHSTAVYRQLPGYALLTGVWRF